MNRRQMRASNREGKRRQKMPWNQFQDVTLESKMRSQAFNSLQGYKVDKVYQNNKYIVQIKYRVPRDGDYYTRAMIRRSDSAAIYSWQDMFRIKNEVFGNEVEAIQFFPRSSELVDSANLYWLWIKE